MKVFVILLVLIGLFTSSAFAFEPSSTNYFSNPEFKIYKVQENSYEFSIPYKISDAKLDRIVVDCDSTALIIYLDAVDTEGNLIINIPRALLDAKIGEQDDALFFILDQQEIEPQEINTDSDSRTFDIPLQTDGKLLEIIASSVGMFPEPIPCGVDGADKSPYYRLLSPLKQFNSGIPFDEIHCKQNLILIQKYDGSPACVTESTKQKLVEREWTGANQVTQDSLLERFSTMPEVIAFYETYEDAESSVKDDHVSYFAGSDDSYFVRMNLMFDENHSIMDIDFHCYYQKIHQYEFPQEDITSNIPKYDCREYHEK